MNADASWVDRASKAVLLIRVLVGWVFLSEGIQKFLFPDSLGVGRFVKIGIPWPQDMAPFVGVVEIVCGSLLLSLRGHSRAVTSVAWDPDGQRLATGSNDTTAKVWSAETGDELLTLRGHASYVNSNAWSPDGKWLATASDDGTVQVYPVDLRDLMALARERVTAHPSEAGCKKYLHVDTCPPVPHLSSEIE